MGGKGVHMKSLQKTDNGRSMVGFRPGELNKPPTKQPECNIPLDIFKP